MTPLDALLGLMLVAFAVWGQAVGFVTFHDQPTGVAAAAPMRDGSCGIFIGPFFATAVASGAAEWFPQSVMTHEVGHCLGHVHPAEYRLSIMIPNIPAPNAEDLRIVPNAPWFQPFTHRLTMGVARD